MDYGQGIRRCLAQLRQTLNNRASQPLFIQTERNRGCRFIAPVRISEAVTSDSGPDLVEAHPPLRTRAFPVPQWPFGAAALILVAVLALAIRAPAYGLAIFAFWLGAVLVIVGYSEFRSTPTAKVVVVLYLIAAMSYTASGSTMPPLLASVVNMTSLPPASVFPFVMGLKFMPVFVLVLIFWAILGDLGFEGNPYLRFAYSLSGIFMLLATATSVLAASGDQRIWQAGVPGRWALAAGFSVVMAINVVVWYFKENPASDRRRPLWLRLIAYLPVALIAFFVDGEYNQINRYYLDVRWPDAYVAASPEAAEQFRGSVRERIGTEVGPKLANLLKDPAFLQALRKDVFYKQHLDEPFQLSSRAVIFGYRRELSHAPSSFVTIRFPQELADALGFHAVVHK